MRHRNHGVRKRCHCKRKIWPKCPHGWHLNFTPRGGQDYRLSLDVELGRHIDSKTEADAEATRIKSEILAGTFVCAVDRREATASSTAGAALARAAADTVESYARRDWLPSAELNLKASTVHFYKDNLENHVFPLLGNLPIAEITRKDCRQLIATARTKGVKIDTVRGIVRTLSTVLSQAVEDELLSANPALGMRKYLRRGDAPESEKDPFTRDDAAHLVETARKYYPEWHPWVLCGLRTGLRPGELLALQWGDIDWRGRFIQLQRNLVRGKLTTPKSHQCRQVDISPQLRAVLRLWRRQQRAAWLQHGQSLPSWIFPSATGTFLDESNVRKAFNRILDRAELHRRGPHQMRHTFASLLLQAGEPITYVSRQLGHKDSSITLRVYAHWLPDANERKGVDQLDESVAQPLHTPSLRVLRKIA
jgi:integrase